MRVRLNDYHDLPAIQALYGASGKGAYPFWNWSCNTHGWWLIAEDDDTRPMGCVQLGLSQPQAFVDLLCVPTIFTKRLKATVIYTLLHEVHRVLRSFGVRTFIFQADAQTEWARIVERYGAQRVHSHPTYVMQVN